MKSELDELAAEVRELPRAVTAPKDMLSTGSTQLNLACSGNPHGAFPKGTYALLVGDSASGKTWILMNTLAEASRGNKFKEYDLVYDGPENGAMMNVGYFFGDAAVKRIRPPKGTQDEPEYSSTVEEFYYNLDTLFKAGKPFVYALDSMDALTTADEQDKFQDDKKAFEKGKDAGGSYGTSKAKENSAKLRVVCNQLKETGSILLVVAQTRENIGFGAQFNPKTRGGGKALSFYAHLELWTSLKEKTRTEVAKGKKKTTGIVSLVKVKKNRITGKEREALVPIIYDYGIDDVGANVDFLLEWSVWDKVTGGYGYIKAGEFGEGRRDTLIKAIEDNGKEPQLRRLVAEQWDSIERSLMADRKRRYS